MEARYLNGADVEEAVKLNRSLMSVSQHQQCVADTLRQQVTALRQQLVEARAASHLTHQGQGHQGQGHQSQGHQGQGQGGSDKLHATLKHENHRLKARVSALEMEKSSCKRELETCHDNWQKSLNNLRTAQTLVQQHQEDDLAHQREVTSLQDHVQQLQQDVGRLTMAHHTACLETERLRELRTREDTDWSLRVSEKEEECRGVREKLEVSQTTVTTTQDHLHHLTCRLQHLTHLLNEAQAKLNPERASTPTQTDVSFFMTSCASAQTEGRRDVSVATQVTSETEEASSQTESAGKRDWNTQTERVEMRAAPCQTYVPSLVNQAAQTSHKDHVCEVGVQTDDTTTRQQDGDDGSSDLSHLSDLNSLPSDSAEDTSVSPHLASTQVPPPASPPPYDSTTFEEKPERITSNTSQVSRHLKRSVAKKGQSYTETAPLDITGPETLDVAANSRGEVSQSAASNIGSNAIYMVKSVPGFTRVFAARPQKPVRNVTRCDGDGERVSQQTSSTPAGETVGVEMLGNIQRGNRGVSRKEDLNNQPPVVLVQEELSLQTSSSDGRAEVCNPVHDSAHETQAGEEGFGDEAQSSFHHFQKEGARRAGPQLSSASDIIISPTEPHCDADRLVLKDQDSALIGGIDMDTVSGQVLLPSSQLQSMFLRSDAENSNQSETSTTSGKPRVSTYVGEKSLRNVKLASAAFYPTLFSTFSPSCSSSSSSSSSKTPGLSQTQSSNEAGISRGPRPQGSKLALRSFPKGGTSCLSVRLTDCLEGLRSSVSTSSGLARSDVRSAASSSSETLGKLTSSAGSAKDLVRKPSPLVSVPTRKLALPFSTYGNPSTCALPFPSPVPKTSGLSAKQSGEAESKGLQQTTKRGILKGNNETEAGREKTVTFAPVNTQRPSGSSSGGVEVAATDSDNSSDDQILFSDIEDDNDDDVAEKNSPSITASQCQRIVSLLEDPQEEDDNAAAAAAATVAAVAADGSSVSQPAPKRKRLN
ncbi:hypothetical protein ACOMHN_032929 [Nucella lapillus]